MKIAKALKTKNKLVKELQVLLTRAQKNNSVIEGKVRSYSSKEMLDQANKKIDELIDLKTKISLANQSVQYKIYRLSELKSLISYVQDISTLEGPSETSSWRDKDKIVNYISEIKTVERDEFIQNIENEIEKIQEELDIYNNTIDI